MGDAAAVLTVEELARRLWAPPWGIREGISPSKEKKDRGRTAWGYPARSRKSLAVRTKGSFVAHAEGQMPLAVASLFATVFKDAGWRQITSGHLIEDELKAARLDAKSFGMGFIFKDRHQISIAAQAIDEVFAKHGFRTRKNDERREMSGPEHSFRGLLLFGEGRQP